MLITLTVRNIFNLNYTTLHATLHYISYICQPTYHNSGSDHNSGLYFERSNSVIRQNKTGGCKNKAGLSITCSESTATSSYLTGQKPVKPALRQYGSLKCLKQSLYCLLDMATPSNFTLA